MKRQPFGITLSKAHLILRNPKSSKEDIAKAQARIARFEFTKAREKAIRAQRNISRLVLVYSYQIRLKKKADTKYKKVLKAQMKLKNTKLAETKKVEAKVLQGE